MKILYLITKSESGGAQTHVSQLVNFFVVHGHEVSVMAYPGGWLEEKTLQLGGVFLPNNYFANTYNPFKILRAMREIRKTVVEIKPDIIHCHSSAAAFMGRLAIKKRIPTLYTAHGWGFNIGVSNLQKYVSILAEKLVSKYTDKIICVSKFVRDLGLTYHIAPENKFEIIYNGVEPTNLKKNKSDNTISILFVGRLEDPKDPILLLEAIAKMPTELMKKMDVHIVGEGNKLGEIEAYISKYSLSQVTLHGGLPRERIFDILASSDIFVLPTKWEGLPLTILEAMSVGLPVLASNVGGIPEVIEDGVNGFLIENDAVVLCDILKKLILDKNLREEMGVKSKEICSEKFSFGDMLEKNRLIYENLTRNK